MAQFNHPELGGQGQWMPGMLMIGDMFNTALRAKVEGLIAVLQAMPTPTTPPVPPAQPGANWWDATLGPPAQVGTQNDTAYAYFPAANVLELRHGALIARYDTTGHLLTGAQQGQANGWRNLQFTTPAGTVTVADFTHIADRPLK